MFALGSRHAFSQECASFRPEDHRVFNGGLQNCKPGTFFVHEPAFVGRKEKFVQSERDGNFERDFVIERRRGASAVGVELLRLVQLLAAPNARIDGWNQSRESSSVHGVSNTAGMKKEAMFNCSGDFEARWVAPPRNWRLGMSGSCAKDLRA